MINIPSCTDISLEVNGNRIGVAQSYSAKHARDKSTYALALSRVCFNSEIDVSNLPIFNVFIHKPDRKIIFCGCEWASFDERGQSGNVIESLAAIASKRMEIA